MHILILKNHNSRKTAIEKYNEEDYAFPTLKEAEERGALLINKEGGEFNAFNTMELNHFLTMCIEKGKLLEGEIQ